MVEHRESKVSTAVHFSVVSIRRVYGFETCTKPWFYLFISLFIHWSLHMGTSELLDCDSHKGNISLVVDYAQRRDPICSWNEKTVLFASVDLWKWHRNTLTHTKTHSCIHSTLCTHALTVFVLCQTYCMLFGHSKEKSWTKTGQNKLVSVMVNSWLV